MDKIGGIDVAFIILVSFIIGVVVVLTFDDPTTATVIWLTASVLAGFIILIVKSMVEDSQEAKQRAKGEEKGKKFLEISLNAIIKN